MLSCLQAVETALQVPVTVTSPVPAFTHKDSSPQEVKLQAHKQRGVDLLPLCRFLFSAACSSRHAYGMLLPSMKYSPAGEAALLKMVNV